jgi:hypothetical protein
VERRTEQCRPSAAPEQGLASPSEDLAHERSFLSVNAEGYVHRTTYRFMPLCGVSCDLVKQPGVEHATWIIGHRVYKSSASRRTPSVERGGEWRAMALAVRWCNPATRECVAVVVV